MLERGPETVLLLIGLYLLLINAAAILVYGVDKWKAKHGAWRIAESTLLLYAALGGALGSLLAMKLFHHKTLKPKFTVGVPVLLGLHILMILGAVWYFYLRPYHGA